MNKKNTIKKNIPKPFLKWVGGKTQIIDKLFKKLPKEINNYYEIFVGGGSFLIMILWANKEELISIKGTINVFDLNEALIGTYINIQKNSQKLYKIIKKFIDEYNNCKIDGEVNRKPKTKNEAMTSRESYYYYIRKLYNKRKNKKSLLSSAYFIFLNKTGFRGMYREGPNGYNIPYGNYKNPKIIEKKELEFISDLIQNVNFVHSDFSESFNSIEDEDNFIYLDPPYAPENSKSFVGYTKNGFNLEQHKLLFNNINKINKKNKVMMSNANVKMVHDNLLKDEYNYEIVTCRRAINSKDPSAKTEEVIITNY